MSLPHGPFQGLQQILKCELGFRARKNNLSSKRWIPYPARIVKTQPIQSHRFSGAAGRTVAFGLVAARLAACHLAAAEPLAPRKVATVEGITEYHYNGNGLRTLLFPDQS